MNYDRKIIQTEINSLVGEIIKDIFYYTEYDGFKTFKELSTEVVEVPLLGILMKTSFDNYYSIISYDYAPYYELGGIRLFREKSFKTLGGRPSQINEAFWRYFKYKKILSINIIENYYKKQEKTFTVPFGLKMVFDNKEECYLMNMTIEDFIEESNIYEISRGGGVVLFAGRDTFNKYSNFKEDTFYI